MRFLRIAALWALAIGLAVAYREGTNLPSAPPADEVPLVRAPLIVTPETDIAEIVLRDGGVRVAFGRGGRGWVVTDPVGAAVAPDLLQAFVDALTAAVVLDAIPDGGAAGYGLDDGRRIEIVSTHGVRETLIVGGQTPTGTSAYVRDAAGAVRVIGRNPLVYRDLILNAGAAPPGKPTAVLGSDAGAIDQDL